MTTTRESLTTAPSTEAPARPSALRRVAIGVTGVVGCLAPTVWGLGTVAEPLTGAERDHLFPQLTSQGLLLSALWVGGLLPLLVAGWRGRRPSAAAGLAALAVPVTGLGLVGLAAGGLRLARRAG